jgi:imidazolonepropionase-like amidohydrolase
VQLTQEDAQLAAKHQVVVVTTTVARHFHPAKHSPAHSGTHSQEASSPHNDHQRSPAQNISDMAKIIQAHNLTLLHQAKVKIAIGSDHAETALAEALNLYQLDVFDNLTLLKMWCETTPQAIFPSRKIGRLDEGYEASFLVLADNPIDDFRNVETITLRFKQGVELSGSWTK